ncbi:TPA: hypothetical protein HA241_06440 [Candidatus Woesearchaeota archaeon]|nr:hypothetical protein [Candidatus Woesearchaeota archaeon]
MRKVVFSFVMIALLVLPLFVTAAGPLELLKKVFKDVVLAAGSLSFLGSSDVILIGITRLLIWIALFTIFFGVLSAFGAGARAGAPTAANWASIFSRNQAMVIAFVLATISTIFMPAQVLQATGTGWATVVALGLIGLPIVGVWYLLYTMPDTRGWVFLKIVLCMLLLWILAAMKAHVTAVNA